MGALGILITAAAERRASKLHFNAAMRRSHKIASQAMRDMTNVAQHADRIERRKLAAAELPAGKTARFVHRADQLGTLAEKAVIIMTAIVAIRAAIYEFKQPLTKGE